MKYMLFFIPMLFFSSGAIAEIKTEVIEYRQGDTVLEGFLAYDASVTGRRPGVLIVHEWWGLNDYARDRAKQLAGMGYMAFALDMYGKGVLAQNPQQAAELAGRFYKDRQLMRSRAAAGLEVLKSQYLTDTTRLAAIGFCFGGSTVLELARSGAELNGFVSFHGGLSTPNPGDAANIQGEVLVLHGGDDPHVPMKDVMAFWKEMREADVKWQMNIYGGAVHSFSNPAAGNDISSGAAYNESAAKRAWRDMQQFFKEIFVPHQENGVKR